jgi:hypothetical protein
LGDPAKKSRIVLKAILEPIILGREPDEHASRFAVPRDNDLFLLRITEVPGKIVLSLVKRDLSHFSLPTSRNQSSACSFDTIART